MSRAVTHQCRRRNNSDDASPDAMEPVLFLRSDLPFDERMEIATAMDTSGAYKDIANCLKYSQHDVEKLTLEFQKPNSSPMMRLFLEWETLNPTMLTVFRYFARCGRIPEMERLKKYVPKKYHKEIPRSENDLRMEDIFDDSDGEDDSTSGGRRNDTGRTNTDTSQKLDTNDPLKNWKPRVALESDWDDSQDIDSIDKSHRKISAESDGSLINVNLRVDPGKAPPPDLCDKVKNLSLSTDGDSLYANQAGSLPDKNLSPLPPERGTLRGQRQAIEASPPQPDSGESMGFTFQSVEEMQKKYTLATTHAFDYDELREAAKNWSEDLKIGEGAFGIVYRLNLRHTTFAVKRLTNDGALPKASDEYKHFLAELSKPRRFNHPNIIQIIGCGFGPELCIVYEHMPNGSLFDKLMVKDCGKPLPWKDRVAILRGAARGLNYLHTLDIQNPLIHGDIKSANVLLDRYLTPKISDFGLAIHAVKATEKGQITHVTCEQTYIHGTKAYLPKSFVTNPVVKRMSVKTDVHGFGVVMAEALTGLRARTRNPNSKSRAEELLVDILDDCESEKELLSLKDKKPANDYPSQLILDLFNISKKCTAERKQPKMEQVLTDIKSIENKFEKYEVLKNPVRLEQTAPPNVVTDPLLKEIRHIERQQANMATSKPVHSLSSQPFYSGIPSLPDVAAATLPPIKFSQSGQSRSLPTGNTKQVPSAACASVPTQAAQSNLSLQSSEISDSADLYRSSSSNQLLSGGVPQAGIVNSNAPPQTPLPPSDCSVPLNKYMQGPRSISSPSPGESREHVSEPSARPKTAPEKRDSSKENLIEKYHELFRMKYGRDPTGDEVSECIKYLKKKAESKVSENLPQNTSPVGQAGRVPGDPLHPSPPAGSDKNSAKVPQTGEQKSDRDMSTANCDILPGTSGEEKESIVRKRKRPLQDILASNLLKGSPDSGPSSCPTIPSNDKVPPQFSSLQPVLKTQMGTQSPSESIEGSEELLESGTPGERPLSEREKLLLKKTNFLHDDFLAYETSLSWDGFTQPETAGPRIASSQNEHTSTGEDWPMTDSRELVSLPPTFANPQNELTSIPTGPGHQIGHKLQSLPATTLVSEHAERKVLDNPCPAVERKMQAFPAEIDHDTDSEKTEPGHQFGHKFQSLPAGTLTSEHEVFPASNDSHPGIELEMQEFPAEIDPELDTDSDEAEACSPSPVLENKNSEPSPNDNEHSYDNEPSPNDEDSYDNEPSPNDKDSYDNEPSPNDEDSYGNEPSPNDKDSYDNEPSPNDEDSYDNESSPNDKDSYDNESSPNDEDSYDNEPLPNDKDSYDNESSPNGNEDSYDNEPSPNGNEDSYGNEPSPNDEDRYDNEPLPNDEDSYDNEPSPNADDEMYLSLPNNLFSPPKDFTGSARETRSLDFEVKALASLTDSGELQTVIMPPGGSYSPPSLKKSSCRTKVD